MKQKRRVINFILTLVCCLCVFLGSGVESRAEEEFVPRSGTFEVDGKEFHYYYITDFVSYNNGQLQNTWHRDEPVYFIYYKSGSTNVWAAVSFNNSSMLRGGKTYIEPSFRNGLYMFFSTGSNQTTDFPIEDSENNNIYYLVDQFISYMKSDDFNDLLTPPWEPDFNHYYHEDTDRWLNDLRAQVEDNTLYATWDGLAGIGLHVLEGYENMFVQFHLQFIDDKGTTNISDDEYTDLYDFYTELEFNEFSVDLSEFDVPEGYRLWCMWAEPYWYFNDDINSTMFKGKLSYLFFDEDGMSDAPLIKDTGDIYNPLDPNLSNWNAITNFTGDYFYNMGNVMNNTFNNWDSTSMDESNRYLGDSLANYGNHENAIVNQVSNNLEGFEFDYYLSFSDKVNAGIAFGSSLINKFFTVSGDFTILFVVGCVMVFIFVVVGIWRFSK